MSIGFFAKLLFSLPDLISELSLTVKQNTSYYWGGFTFTFLLNLFFWIATYFMFKIGRKLYKTES